MGIYYKISDFRHNVKHFFRNLPLFLKLCWNWRDFDSHFSIEVFCELLMENGRACKRYDHHIAAEKQYRKACKLAGNLHRAYNAQVYDRAGYRYMIDRYPLEMRESGDTGYYVIQTDYKGNKYAEKIIDRQRERYQAIIEQSKKEAWEQIHKHVEDVWD